MRRSKAKFWREWIRALATKRLPDGTKIRKGKDALNPKSRHYCCFGVGCAVHEQLGYGMPQAGWRSNCAWHDDVPIRDLAGFGYREDEMIVMEANDEKRNWPIALLIDKLAPKRLRSELHKIAEEGRAA